MNAAPAFSAAKYPTSTVVGTLRQSNRPMPTVCVGCPPQQGEMAWAATQHRELADLFGRLKTQDPAAFDYWVEQERIEREAAERCERRAHA